MKKTTIKKPGMQTSLKMSEQVEQEILDHSWYHPKAEGFPSNLLFIEVQKCHAPLATFLDLIAVITGEQLFPAEWVNLQISNLLFLVSIRSPNKEARAKWDQLAKQALRKENGEYVLVPAPATLADQKETENTVENTVEPKVLLGKMGRRIIRDISKVIAEWARQRNLPDLKNVIEEFHEQKEGLTNQIVATVEGIDAFIGKCMEITAQVGIHATQGISLLCSSGIPLETSADKQSVLQAEMSNVSEMARSIAPLLEGFVDNVNHEEAGAQKTTPENREGNDLLNNANAGVSLFEARYLLSDVVLPYLQQDLCNVSWLGRRWEIDRNVLIGVFADIFDRYSFWWRWEKHITLRKYQTQKRKFIQRVLSWMEEPCHLLRPIKPESLTKLIPPPPSAVVPEIGCGKQPANVL